MTAGRAALAQTDTTSAASSRLLQGLRPGVTLRVLVGAHATTGVLQRASRDSLYLEGRTVGIADIGRIQVRQRATRSGLKWGAITGGIGGAVFGALAGYVFYGVCEVDCPDSPNGAVIFGTLGGGAGGLIAGGVLGAVVGSALPKWVDLRDPAANLTRASPRHIGTVTFAPVVARASNSQGTGAGARAAFLFQTRHFSLGPEVAWQALGTNQRPVFVPCGNLNGCTDTIPLRENVLQLGGVARLGTGSDRHIEPFATVGTGFYVWSRNPGNSSIGLLGYSLGGGLQLRAASGRRSLFGEARWQSNLSASGDPNPAFGFYTFALGGALAW
ncbi:MAG TPA: hypothetical protein VF021_12835 [Longimicrobiales bacterium]